MTPTPAKPSPMALLRTTARRARFAWDHQPLTLLSVALLSAAAWGFWGYSRASSDYVVYALSAAAGGIVLLSLLVTLIAAGTLVFRLKRMGAGVSGELMAQVTVKTQFSPPTLRWWPLVQVDTTWLTPAAVTVVVSRERGKTIEQVTPAERARSAQVVRAFVVRDIFGFSRIRLVRRWDTPIRITPSLGRADVALAVRRATAEGWSHPAGQPQGERVDMRRYAAGDPMRYILWKTYARNRQLMVRQAERAIAPKPAMVAFFAAGAGDEPSASTARLFLKERLFGQDFAFMAEGAARPTKDPDTALTQIIDSRAHRATGADSLMGLFRAVDRTRLDNLILFVPSREGAWVAKVLTAARRLPLAPLVIMTVDGRLDLSPQGRLQRFLWGRRDDETARDLADIPRLHDILTRAGVDLRIVHRGTGQRLVGPRLEALRALGSRSATGAGDSRDRGARKHGRQPLKAEVRQ